MRVTLTFCAVILAAPGCGASRLAASTRFTSVPTYASTSGSARGGGPTVVCGPNVPTGTRFQARLDTPIHTANAVPGQPFYATVTQPIEGSRGGTIVPAGTQVIGRVYDARASRRLFGVAHLAIGVEGLNLGSTYIPITARVISANVQSRRANFLSRIEAQIPTGSTMVFDLEEPVPVAALQRSAQHSARGGGP